MKKFTIVLVALIAFLGLHLNAQVLLNLKVFLEGAFNGTSMNTTLNTENLIPLNQPYNSVPWSYSGTESVSSVPDAAIVDWVLVELRETTGDASTATPDKKINRQAAFLEADGSIVGIDGSSMIGYSGTITANLFVIIWHRNHLAVMSSAPLTNASGVYSWDFTNLLSKAYLDGQKQIGTGVFGMMGGDSDANKKVETADKYPGWNTNAGALGYIPVDLNLDSQVNNADKNNVWEPNLGAVSQIPSIIPFVCGDSFVDPRDDQSYTSVQISSQCWMAENLNIGTVIPGATTMTNNSIIEKYCYNDSTQYCDMYGGLYQWNEMMQYSTVAGTQGICPSGWHIPTDPEWCTLTQFIDPTVNCTATWSGTDVGTKMKSETGWDNDGNGTNDFGFTALPAGYLDNYNNFNDEGSYTYMWSSTQGSSTFAWYRILYDMGTSIGRVNQTKLYGFSVRCVKN